MPSRSDRQARFMAAAAHNPTFRAKAGVPLGVAQEFNQADARSGTLDRAMKRQGFLKGRGMAKGGRVRGMGCAKRGGNYKK